jgi:four helix bundle protein
MKKSLIKEKSYSFAMVIIGLYKTLLKQNEFVLSKQLLRSGTSIGAKERRCSASGFPA